MADFGQFPDTRTREDFRQKTAPLTDEQLLKLAHRFEDASRHIQGFLYEPNHVIRDLRKLPGEQVIWRERAEEQEAFENQMLIERMRFAMEDAP